VNAVDFLAVEQQLALAVRVVATEANGEGPRWNVRLKEPEFTIVNALPSRSDFTSEPVSTMPHSKVSRMS